MEKEKRQRQQQLTPTDIFVAVHHGVSNGSKATQRNVNGCQVKVDKMRKNDSTERNDTPNETIREQRRKRTTEGKGERERERKELQQVFSI